MVSRIGKDAITKVTRILYRRQKTLSVANKMNSVVGSVQVTVIIQDYNHRIEVLTPEPARINGFKIATKEGNDLIWGDILEFSIN